MQKCSIINEKADVNIKVETDKLVAVFYALRQKLGHVYCVLVRLKKKKIKH